MASSVEKLVEVTLAADGDEEAEDSVEKPGGDGQAEDRPVNSNEATVTPRDDGEAVDSVEKLVEVTVAPQWRQRGHRQGR